MSVPLREWLESVPWLRRLPAGWSVVRFKAVATLSTHDNVLHDARLLSLSTSRGIVPKQYDDENRVRTGEDLRRYWRVRAGHLVVNPMWLAHGSVASAGIDGVISPDYRVYDVARSVDAGYLASLLRTAEYRALYELFVRGSTTYDRRVSKDDFQSIPIIVPPLQQQRAVARYLDRQTAAIDAVIAKKERIIELLQEKRQALITQAVTKGLDPNVPMKAPGIPWLGEMPAHWRQCQLRHVSVEGSRNGLYKGKEHYASHGTPIVSMGEAFAQPMFERTAAERVVLTDAELRTYGLGEGDLLFARRSLVFEGSGKCSLVGRLGEPHVFESSIIRVRIDRARALPTFAFFFMSSHFSRNEVLSRTKQVTISGVDGQQVRALTVLVPPLAEQAAIVDYLMGAVQRIDRLTARIQEQIEKIREYRQTLITAAVTGKIDVSSEAA